MKFCLQCKLLSCLFFCFIWAQQAAASCDGFTEIAVFEETVYALDLGFDNCNSSTGELLPDFKSTRFVWTIRPSAGNVTVVSSTPPGVVVPIMANNFTSTDFETNETVVLTALKFEVGIPNLDTEAGVLIEVPAHQLQEIFTELTNGALVMAQIEDGFTQLDAIRFREFTTLKSTKRPGDGMIVNAKVTQSEKPLSLDFDGYGIKAEIEAKDIYSISMFAEQSSINIKADRFGTTDNDRGAFRILGKQLCITEECNSELNVFIEASLDFPDNFDYDLTGPVNLKIHDTSNSSSTEFCENAINENLAFQISCMLTDETIAFPDPLPCTNSPDTDQDVFFCKNVDYADWCACTPVQPPQQPSRGSLVHPASFAEFILILSTSVWVISMV